MSRIYYGKTMKQYIDSGYKQHRKSMPGRAGYRSNACLFGQHSHCHAKSCGCFCHSHGLRRPKYKKILDKRGKEWTVRDDGYYSRDEYSGKW